MRAPATIRVLIVDDDPMVRGGLRAILGAAEDLQIVGEAADGDAALAMAGEHLPHVVLMDIRMPGRDGIDATRALCRRPEAPRVVILTTFDLDEHVLDSLRAGASGFLVKDLPPRRLIEAVRTVAAGEAMLAPAVTRALIERFNDPETTARRDAARAALDGLTARESDVAHAVARGLSNADIAAELHLAEATVKAHVSQVLAKLDAANRVQIALVVNDAAR